MFKLDTTTEFGAHVAKRLQQEYSTVIRVTLKHVRGM